MTGRSPATATGNPPAGIDAGVRDRMEVSRPATAVLWNALGLGGRQIMQFASMIVLARALSPQHFGAVGMVLVVMALAGTVADLGLGVALVQHRNLNTRHLDAAFWITISAGAVVTALLWIAAPAVAAFYGEPILTPLARAAAFQFALQGAGVVPRALLVRRVQFRALATVELCTGAAAAAGAIAFALAGAGVWALIAPILISATVSAGLSASFARWRPTSLAGPRDLAAVASFSRDLIAFRMVNYGARNTDDLLIGRFLGPASLGLYGLAYQLVLVPLQQVAAIIGDVMVPVMSRCKEDVAGVRLAFTRAVQATALVLFPLMAGLFIVAGEALPVVFGDQWQGAVGVARVLAIGGCFQALGVTVGWVYQSQGRSDIMLRWGFFATVIAICGMVAGLPWGIVGVATGYTCAVLLLTPLSHFIAGRLIGLTLFDLISCLKPALLATAAMAVLAGAARTALLAADLSDALILLGSVASGAAAYTAAVALLRPVSLDLLGPVLYWRSGRTRR